MGCLAGSVHFEAIFTEIGVRLGRHVFCCMPPEAVHITGIDKLLCCKIPQLIDSNGSRFRAF